jgi:hypothetical protein
MVRPLDRHRPVTHPEVLPDVEQSVVLAHKHAPVLRITGVIRSVQPGRRDLSLSDTEWESVEPEAGADGRH